MGSQGPNGGSSDNLQKTKVKIQVIWVGRQSLLGNVHENHRSRLMRLFSEKKSSKKRT